MEMHVYSFVNMSVTFSYHFPSCPTWIQNSCLSLFWFNPQFCLSNTQFSFFFFFSSTFFPFSFLFCRVDNSIPHQIFQYFITLKVCPILYCFQLDRDSWCPMKKNQLNFFLSNLIRLRYMFNLVLYFILPYNFFFLFLILYCFQRGLRFMMSNETKATQVCVWMENFEEKSLYYWT